MKEKQLLCTFSDDISYKHTIQKIKGFYNVIENKFFIFRNSKNIKEYYITYNIVYSNIKSKFPYTISIHRKKTFNTLYTLNAMNRLIADENGGNVGEFNEHQLDWALYKNSLILTNDPGTKIIPLTLLEILS